MFLFILTSCGPEITIFGIQGNPKNIVSGVISPLVGRIASLDHSSFLISSATASLCTAPFYAKIFKINVNGTIDENDPLDSFLVGSDARYSFNLKELQQSNSVDYIVRASGCDGNIYERPITDFNHKQDLNARTTVVAYVNKASTIKKLNEVSRRDVQTLIDSLNGENTGLALTSLLSSTDNSNKFIEIFGSSPKALKDAKGEFSFNYPDSFLNELSPASFSITTFHIDPDYPFFYRWEFQGAVVSTTKNWNYIPSANDSGDQKVDVYIGQDDGTGNIDLIKPFYTKKIMINVNNNIFPVSPTIAINVGTLSPRKINSILVDINTGEGFKNCLSFSKMAITESATPPNESSFNILCNTEGSQTESVSYSTGDGVKKIYLWAIDKEGMISSASLVPEFILDTQPPILSLNFLKDHVKGGENYNIIFNASDVGSGLADLDLYFSADNGSSFSLVSQLALNTNVFSWTAPSINTSLGKLKLIATDLLGFTTIIESHIFVIDSTAPVAPNLTRVSNAISNLSLVSMTIGSCIDTSYILITESNIPPNESSVGWQACSTNVGITIATIIGQGTHNLYAWAKDIVGNVSLSANTVSVILDTLKPSIIVTTPIALRGNTNFGTVNWTLTEANASASSNFLIEVFDGLVWSTVGTKAVTAGNNSSQIYNLSNFSVPNIDTSFAKVRVSLTDAAGNSSNNESNVFTIDKIAPVISSFIINDGATYAGTAMVNIKVKVSDNFSSGNQIGIRLNAAHNGSSDCQSEYVDNNWKAWTNSTSNIGFSIIPTDGIKKICVWAKDAAGNVTVTSPTAGTNGINTSTIEFSTGNSPEVLSFSAVTTLNGTLATDAGKPLTLSWSASDVEGLDNSPISIAYTTDNLIWKDIHTNKDINESINRTWYGSFSGNPKSVGGTIVTFNSPSSSYFKLKIQSKDMAGNTSSFVTSQPFNIGNWSIYAGTNDRGDNGTGRAAALFGGGLHSQFAINPISGDIYAVDNNKGLRKLNASTGIVSTVIQNGIINLPNNGSLPPFPIMPVDSYSNPIFDSKGRLYISIKTPGGEYVSNIYQIDFQQSTVRLYAGGGVQSDGGNLSTSLQIATGAYSFDEQDSLYVWTFCGGTMIKASTSSTQGKRIVKIVQNTDGSPGTTTRIIGNCTLGNPTSGSAANNQPSSQSGGPLYAGIIAWNNGNTILVLNNYGNRYKILNGVVYSSNVSTINNSGFGLYNPEDGFIYKTGGSNGVEKVAINTSGPNGDTTTSLFATNSISPGCTQDGAFKTSFCGLVITKPQIRSGVLYFTDGSGNNTGSEYAIRYFDNNNQLRTVFGGQPFEGDGKDKSLMRGKISGIYYKKSSEINKTAFPEGLYFVERAGLVFGHIDPTTGVVSNLWGNQARTSFIPSTGTTISKNLSMGPAYSGGNGMPLTFDTNGLPWLRANSDVISIDEFNKIVRRTNQSVSNNIQDAVSNVNPQNYGLYPYGGYQNFTLKGNGLFIQPNFTSGNADPILSIRFMDFTSLATPIILGGNHLSSEYSPASTDINLAGGVAAAPLWNSCKNMSSCFMNYHSVEDRLYFAEGMNMRYITTPSNTLTATLGTLFTSITTSITNFSFTPDYSQMWYFKEGGLYCHKMTSLKSWCDDTTDYFAIRSAAGFSVTAWGPNQITFKDNQTLFLSTYGGEILQFNLPN